VNSIGLESDGQVKSLGIESDRLSTFRFHKVQISKVKHPSNKEHSDRKHFDRLVG
jgi:hypothetical protein